MLDRVFVINPVDFGGFDNDLTGHLKGEVERSGVGGQEWPTGATTDDDDSALLQVIVCSAEGVVIDELIDFYRGEWASW